LLVRDSLDHSDRNYVYEGCKIIQQSAERYEQGT
jgi:hypothetical protein